MSTPFPRSRMDRRVAIKWIATASASLAVLDQSGAMAEGGQAAESASTPAKGYGPDPRMVKVYQPGELWPLTFTESQHRTATALCDVIIPADETSPSASAVGVPEFLDEWVSSPYSAQAPDRKLILAGLDWIDEEARRRFSAGFADLSLEQKTVICDDICNPAKAQPDQKQAVPFFKRYRDLTAGGYYTTPAGMKAIGYVGNLPMPRFAGPPLAALRHVGLA